MSNKPTPTFKWEDLDTAIGQFQQHRLEARPPGTFTTVEYAERHRKSLRNARHALRRLLRVGVIEVAGTLWVIDKRGRLNSHARYYRVKANP
jgi:hypothetical protein